MTVYIAHMHAARTGSLVNYILLPFINIRSLEQLSYMYKLVGVVQPPHVRAHSQTCEQSSALYNSFWQSSNYSLSLK